MCVRACVHAWGSGGVGECVSACVCVRVCVRACVRACVCVCVHVSTVGAFLSKGPCTQEQYATEM